MISRLYTINSNHLQGKIPLSFDVVSLYTNVNAEEAINTALEYTVKFDYTRTGYSLRIYQNYCTYCWITM